MADSQESEYKALGVITSTRTLDHLDIKFNYPVDYVVRLRDGTTAVVHAPGSKALGLPLALHFRTDFMVDPNYHPLDESKEIDPNTQGYIFVTLEKKESGTSRSIDLTKQA